MIVYRVTNLRNGKVYIGKWQGPRVEDRWEMHLRHTAAGSPYYFHNAIRKYGPDAFKIEVLYIAKNAVELSRMETFFIILHQSHKSENGYNLTMGGEGVLGYRRTGPDHWNYGRTTPSETRSRISYSMQGIIRSEQTKQSVRDTMKARGIKPTVIYDLGFTGPHSEESRDLMREKAKQRLEEDPTLLPTLLQRAVKGNHVRWHEKRNFINMSCELCLGGYHVSSC